MICPHTLWHLYSSMKLFFLSSDKSKPSGHSPILSLSYLKLHMTREQINSAQKENLILQKCFSSVVPSDVAQKRKSAYFVENGLLLHKWCPNVTDDSEWSVVCQIVIPSCYRQQVLSLAHDHDLTGYL